MKVIKRDGKLQDFDLDKIKTSIYRASDDVEQPLNESDIKNLAKEIKKNLEDIKEDKIKFDIIQKFVLAELEKSGFKQVAAFYNLGKLE